MGKQAVGAGRVGWIVGAVAGLACAAACDSGSSTSTDGAAGTAGASSGVSGASQGGSAAGGTTTVAGSAGQSTGGGSGSGATSGSGGQSGGGTGVGDAGASAGGAPEGGDAGVGGEGGAHSGGEGGAGGEQGGTAGTGGVNLGGTGGTSVGCETAQLSFAPLESNVMILVDGSGTMFAGTGPTVWERVRDALLPSIDAVDAQQSIGFLAMSAELNACPAFQEVAPTKNNFAAISSKYSAITKPVKGESPFPLALDRAAQLLDGKAGSKHIVFVIDGEPDYCNDGQPDCAIDSTVWRLQKLRAAGVTTHVAALPFPPVLPDVSASRQSYANAGAGLPVSSFGGAESLVYYSCGAIPKWVEDHTATGKGAETLAGTYSATPGAAPFSALDPNDAPALKLALQQLLAKTRSCSFELTGGAKLALDKASTGTVTLDGQNVPFDASNGWHLQSQTVLEFSGTACTKLRASATGNLAFQFPCAAVIK